MSEFFESPFMFWYGFVFTFLFENGVLILMEWRFTVSFAGLRGNWFQDVLSLAFAYLLAAAAVEHALSNAVQQAAAIVWFTLLAFSLAPAPRRKHGADCLAGALIAVTLPMIASLLFNGLWDLAMVCFWRHPMGLVEMALSVCMPLSMILFLAISFDRLKKRFCRVPSESRYLLLLLLPMFLLLLLGVIYYDAIPQNVSVNEQWPLMYQQPETLLVSGIGLLCFFLFLGAYERLLRALQDERMRDALEQQLALQKSYVREAQARSEQTAAFRHDLNNHLAVLESLLEQGAAQPARQYLETLRQTARCLSPPVHTGSPVLDALLGEKLGLAARWHLAAECAVAVPDSVDPFDLCVLFGNGLDNAIAGARACGREKPRLSIRGVRKDHFYIVEIENDCRTQQPVLPGRGMKNMRAVAEKYGGTLHWEMRDGQFRLSALLALTNQEIPVGNEKKET